MDDIIEETYEVAKKKTYTEEEERLIERATYRWVENFDSIPTSLIAKLMSCSYDEYPDEVMEVTPTDDEREYYDVLPMYGTMWSFDDKLDQDWIEDNLDVMAECGFRIYYQEDIGYFFGIDGAGYDFYEAHWIPLYKARGLEMHKYLRY